MNRLWHNCPKFSEITTYLGLLTSVCSSFLWELMGAMGLIWVFHEEQRATNDLLLVKLSEAWIILKIIQSCGRHLALLLETTGVRSY